MFHEEVKKTIAGVQGAKIITDDITVYRETPELHDQALREKLGGLTLNRAKCFFDQSQIKLVIFCQLREFHQILPMSRH